MHKHHSGDSGSTRLVTQTQADACCAASEHEQSNPSDPMKVTTISPAVLGAGVVTPSITPALVLTDGWRTAESTHSPPVPRHLLFSVFLV
jgi:hypothetical protein